MSERRTLITVITWNRLKLTRNTLKTFIKLNGRDHDFLFVDNGSKDQTVSWLRNHKFEVLCNKRNEGIFMATRRAWLEAVIRGYDFVLNLQNDFPSIRPVPFDDIYAFLDDNPDTGFVQLNNKKYLLVHKGGNKYRMKKMARKKNVLTKGKLHYEKGVHYGNTKFLKSNHHLSFNPNIIRASIINKLVKKVIKPRERQIMENFHKLRLKASRIRKRCFETIIRKRDRRWIH